MLSCWTLWQLTVPPDWLVPPTSASIAPVSEQKTATDETIDLGGAATSVPRPVSLFVLFKKNCNQSISPSSRLYGSGLNTASLLAFCNPDCHSAGAQRSAAASHGKERSRTTLWKHRVSALRSPLCRLNVFRTLKVKKWRRCLRRQRCPLRDAAIRPTMRLFTLTPGWKIGLMSARQES